jgi:hypothetical protein
MGVELDIPYLLRLPSRRAQICHHWHGRRSWTLLAHPTYAIDDGTGVIPCVNCLMDRERAASGRNAIQTLKQGTMVQCKGRLQEYHQTMQLVLHSLHPVPKADVNMVTYAWLETSSALAKVMRVKLLPESEC